MLYRKAQFLNRGLHVTIKLSYPTYSVLFVVVTSRYKNIICSLIPSFNPLWYGSWYVEYHPHTLKWPLNFGASNCIDLLFWIEIKSWINDEFRNGFLSKRHVIVIKLNIFHRHGKSWLLFTVGVNLDRVWIVAAVHRAANNKTIDKRRL